MKQYLILINIAGKDLKWYVYAENGRDAISKALVEVKGEFDHWHEIDVRCKIATSVKED